MKGLTKLWGIAAIGAAMAIGLMGCESSTSGGGGGGCPGGNCFYNSDSDWSFCEQESCALADDYDARCNCN
jgi:hypothetical protein